MICRFGHLLHSRNSTLTRHSKTGKTWMRCLICHAARQRELRQKETLAMTMEQKNRQGAALDPHLGKTIARQVLRELAGLVPSNDPLIAMARRRLPAATIANIRKHLGSPYRHPHGELLGEIAEMDAPL